jgi:hypothetical protein
MAAAQSRREPGEGLALSREGRCCLRMTRSSEKKEQGYKEDKVYMFLMPQRSLVPRR